jgi:hypothetical protein
VNIMRDYIAPGSKTAVLGKEDSRPAYDQAASPRPMPSHQHPLLKLQQQYGNQYVQRALDISRRNGGNLVKPGPRMPSPVKVLSLQRKDEIQRIPVEEEEEALQPGSLAKFRKSGKTPDEPIPLVPEGVCAVQGQQRWRLCYGSPTTVPPGVSKPTFNTADYWGWS